MVVSIRKQGDGFSGAFQVRDERQTTNKREVHGPSCGEVADAMAVVTAIALNSDGENGAPAPVVPLPPPPASSNATPPPGDASPGPGSPAPADDRFRASTRIFPPRTETVRVAAGTLRFDLQRSATLYAGASVGALPGVVMPRYDLSFVAANFVTTPEQAQRISGLVLRLAVGVLGPGTYRSPDTTTDATGLSFGIDLCQAPLYDTKGLVLLFCGGYGGGLMMMKTKGLDGTQIQSKNSGFGEITLSGEAQYQFGAGFHLGARVGGGFNVGDVTAERADGSRIFRSSPWAAYGLLGVGLRF